MKICLVIGFFEAFSGYQEVRLAEELAAMGHEVSVITGNRVDTIFSDTVLENLGLPRTYPVGKQSGLGYEIFRLPIVFDFRKMVFLKGLFSLLGEYKPDLLIALNPGHLVGIFSLIKSLSLSPAPVRIIIFQDNSAWYSNLSGALAFVKRSLFYLIKGPFYFLGLVTSHLRYGNTPNAIKLIRPIAFPLKMRLLPLAFDPRQFYFSPELRSDYREKMGIAPDNVLVISVGKIIAKKEFETLLLHFENTRRTNPQLRLLLIGASNDSYCRKLIDIVENRTLLKGCVWIKKFLSQAEINGYLNAADIGIWHKQPAISIQQGLGTGLFTILPRNDLVGHLLQEKTGSFFDDGDYNSMGKQLVSTSLIGTTTLQQNRRERATLNQRFTQQKVFGSMIEDITRFTKRCISEPYAPQPRAK